MKETRGRQKPRARLADAAAILVLVLVALLLLNSAWHYVAFLRLDLVPASVGSLTQETPAEMILVRQEHLLYAPTAGEFVGTAEAGNRIGAGASVGYIQRQQAGSLALDQTDVVSSQGGVISYDLDGWEEALNPDNVYQTDWQQALEFLRQQSAVPASSGAEEEAVPNLSAGRPVAKVTDNLVPVLAFLCCDIAPLGVEPGGRLTLSLSQGEEADGISGTVKTLGQLAGGQWICLLDLGKNEACLSLARYQLVHILGQTVQGVSIPASALWVNGAGETGVFRREGRSLAFAKVEPLLSKDGQAVVEGLSPTDIVVANPEAAQAGQKLY